MQRTLFKHLNEWVASPDRKPLVIRGARQVGKTWLVRHFAKNLGMQLIELNFEKQASHSNIFNSNDVHQILLNLSAISNQTIDPKKCLLFLDEIQAAPELFSKLRWFAEDLPELAVICAGSLLEFVLEEHSFSMPVGRIGYMHLEPMSFEEFLLAHHQTLYEYVTQYDLNNPIPTAIHEKLFRFFKEYLLIGGLPAVVSSWIKERSLSKVNQIQHDLLATYRDDFSKYKGRLPTERLDEVMTAIPRMLGQKFVFSRVNKDTQAVTMKNALDLLEKARVSHRIKSSSANGLPLAAEIKEKHFKEIFLDTGLCSAALGLNLTQINSIDELIMVNNGGIAEQVVGQLLRTIEPPYVEPVLYCWHREVTGSNAEIDYIIQHSNQIIPIEVKAGRSGGLKSLHHFMGSKKLHIALRINSDYPSKTNVSVNDHARNLIEYTLISIPFYLVGQIHRILQNS